MRNFIVLLLIFAVLTTNVAWALDDCFPPYGSDETVLVQSDDLSTENLNDVVCDELCVGWLHLVAIAPETKLDYFPYLPQDMTRITLSYHSLYQEPPIKPPQI